MAGLGFVLGFLWLFLSWKWGQTFGKLSTINQIVAIWGQKLKQQLTFWTVSKDSGLISSKSDLEYAAFLGQLLGMRVWFPGQVSAGCGSEIYFYRCSGHHLCAYSVSRCVIWDIMTLNIPSEKFL